MNGKSEVSEFYSGLYTDSIVKIEEDSSPFINSFRKDAFEKFSQLGVPTKKNESYKYTNLDLFFKHNYKSYFIPDESDFQKAEDFRCDVTDLDAHGVVLMNGFYPTINGNRKPE
jgi:Fe-S cluster assembly protein SufD